MNWTNLLYALVTGNTHLEVRMGKDEDNNLLIRLTWFGEGDPLKIDASMSPAAQKDNEVMLEALEKMYVTLTEQVNSGLPLDPNETIH